MAEEQDYYATLGVSRTADAAELKRAYRKIALKNHPDRNPGDTEAEERFKQASEAYQVLSDEDQRRVYDRYGKDGLNGQGFQGGGFEDIFGQFSDIFGDIFGGGGGRGRQRRGADLRYDLELSFEEAVFGLKREIKFHRQECCSTCSGSGAAPGSKPTRCGTCQGTGRVNRQQGFFMVQTTCPVCRGAGVIIEERCPTCHGSGMERVERTVHVTIPPGVDSGNRLRIAGEGEGSVQGGARGDLYVFIEVRPDERYQRDGADVYTEEAISISQALLGHDLEVETLHGSESFSIPPGTASGTVVRLRSRGIERVNGPGKGDHFVTVNVTIPTNLNPTQRKLVEALSSEGL